MAHHPASRGTSTSGRHRRSTTGRGGGTVRIPPRRRTTNAIPPLPLHLFLKLLSTCILVLLVACNLGVVVGDEGSSTTTTTTGRRANDDDEKSPPCRLYLAESHAGELPLAFYAGVPVKSGSYLTDDDSDSNGDGGDDVGFHLYDILKHHESLVSDDLVELLWTPSEILSQWEDKSEDSGLVVLSGMGFAGVHNPGVYNARWDRAPLVDRHRRRGGTGGGGGGLLDVRNNPGAGAVSEFHHMKMVAVADLREGTEIFPYFGASWMEAREEEAAEAKQTDPPRYAKSHYDRADSITDDFARLVETHADYFSSRVARGEFWDLIRNEVVTDRKIRNLLPEDPDDVGTIDEVGGSAYRSNPGTIRSVEWLRENGQCVDLLRSGPSTIPGAGRGAFARRPIAAGEVASPGPLVRFTLDQMEIPDEDGNVGAHQLILNYCLAHPSNPRLLFLPHVSGANLINHSSEKPNVQIRWSESPNHNPYPLGLSLDELLTRPVLTGLSVDFVAIGDIAEGEEVLLDYGDAWEGAWTSHVENWAAPEGGGEYDRKTASIVNAEDRPFPTVAERRAASAAAGEEEEDPAPEEEDDDDDEEEEVVEEEETVFVVCSYDDHGDGRDDDDEEQDTYRMDLGDAGTEAVESGGRIRPWRGGDGLTRKENRCEVLLRQEVSAAAAGEDDDDSETNETLYFARLVSDTGERSTRYLADVPHSAMTYVDAPYRGATHRPGTFRHPIGIPDGMFPKAWAAAAADPEDDGGED